MARELSLLALDPGHDAGYALTDPTAPLGCRIGVAELPRHFPDTGKTFVYLAEWLDYMISTHRIEVLCWEEQFIAYGRVGGLEGGRGVRQNQASIEFAFGFCAICDLVGTRRGLRPWAVNIKTARTHFTGSGKAKKDDVWRRAKLLGYDVSNCTLDGSDAVCVYDYARHFLRQKRLIAGPLFAEGARANG